jgi:hypothetical protein
MAEAGKALHWPAHLTSAVLRKNFPQECPDCPAGNLQQRHPAYTPPSADNIGTEFELDYKGKWTDANGRPCPTFRKELYTFTAVDTSSRYIFTKLTTNRAGVVDHLESLRLFALSKDRKIKILRTDHEFITSAAASWARTNFITVRPSVPHEHDTVRLVERTHRTLQEMTVKSLFQKPHLSPSYWGMAYQHCADLHNITSGRDGLSPYALWHGQPFDFKAHPVLPFGSIIAAHTP